MNRAGRVAVSGSFSGKRMLDFVRTLDQCLVLGELEAVGIALRNWRLLKRRNPALHVARQPFMLSPQPLNFSFLESTLLILSSSNWTSPDHNRPSFLLPALALSPESAISSHRAVVQTSLSRLRTCL